MGHHAPDVAQEAHEGVLRRAGCLRWDEALEYKNVFPRGPSNYYEGVMIDDRVGVQLCSAAELPEVLKGAPRRDSVAFAASDSQYKEVGLETNSKKKVRRQSRWEAWGAEVDGVLGQAGPPRRKLVALIDITMVVWSRGLASEDLLETLLGSWAFFLQFRRPMFSLVQVLYGIEAPPGVPKHGPFALTLEARNELALLCSLGFLTVCSLRAVPLERIFCTDASPSGAGVCEAPASQEVVRTLSRRCDRVGYRAALLRPIPAAFRESGREEEYDGED